MPEPIDQAALARTYGFPMTPPSGSASMAGEAPAPRVDPHEMAAAFLRNLAARRNGAPATEPHIPGVNGAMPAGVARPPSTFSDRLRSIIMGVEPQGNPSIGVRG